MNKKRLTTNLIGQLTSFACSLGISFFLTPYVVESLGRDAYGFVGLANSITGYITLFTVAINGMLSRYITIEFNKKEYKSASGYFSTALIAQGILALFLLIPMMLLAANMGLVFDVSPELAPDVKILWAMVFLTFLCGLPAAGYGTATFATNRLDIGAVFGIINNVLRAGILIVTFAFFTPHVWYIGLASIASSTVGIILNMAAKKRLMPEVELGIRHFDKKYIHNLLTVGIWNSLNRLQQILYTGLDLTITNLFINATEMGTLSIAKAIPTQISTLISTISGTFDPTMTISYAKGDMKDFLHQTKFAMKFSGFLCSVPILGFVAFGQKFYHLWMPTLSEADVLKIQILAVLTMLPQVFSVYIFPLYTVNTITTKLKVPVFVSIGIGVANVLIVFTLLKTTTLGVYAVAGVSSILWLFRIFTFVPTYAAWSLKQPWTMFYGPLLKGVLNVVIVGGCFTLISCRVSVTTWMGLVLLCGCAGLFGYVLSFMVMFEKADRQRALGTLKNKFLKKGKAS